MPTYYALGGISKLPTAPDQLNGWTEVFYYNPCIHECTATLTAYFEDKSPVHINESVKCGAQKSGLLVMPNWHPEIFMDAGFWALRFDTDQILDVVVIQVTGPREEMHLAPEYKGGVSNLLGTGLATEWYFADGLWLNWYAALNGDISKAPWPFNEMEYYFFLNPGGTDASLDVNLGYRYIEQAKFHLNVPSGRLRAWCNYGRIPYNQPYGVRVTSDQMIAATSVRYIYGLNGIEEWGIHLHCAMPGKPGPITTW